MPAPHVTGFVGLVDVMFEPSVPPHATKRMRIAAITGRKRFMLRA